MANVNSPFGFLQYQGGAGAAATFGMTRRRVATTAAAIYAGDPVQPVLAANGYIQQGTGSTTVQAGVFNTCQFFNATIGRTVWQNYWPGSGVSTGDGFALVVDDPNARFRVQGGSTTFNITGNLSTFTSSTVGQYAQYTIGTGTVTSGYGKSGAFLSSVNTTVTLPFIVVDLVTDPPGDNGADPTTAFNHVIVGFNNEWMRNNGAGPTGIS